ncbi:hypothetical protein Tco_1119969 [Tanacetum coccineum]
MIGLFDSEIGLPTVAIEPVHEGSASIVKDRKLEDRKRWWNMGLKAIADGKIGCIAFILYCFPNGQAMKTRILHVQVLAVYIEKLKEQENYSSSRE